MRKISYFKNFLQPFLGSVHAHNPIEMFPRGNSFTCLLASMHSALFMISEGCFPLASTREDGTFWANGRPGITHLHEDQNKRFWSLSVSCEPLLPTIISRDILTVLGAAVPVRSHSAKPFWGIEEERDRGKGGRRDLGDFFGCWLIDRGRRSENSQPDPVHRSPKMNIFRLAGDMTHLMSVIVLLLKIHTIKSCAGTSTSLFL